MAKSEFNSLQNSLMTQDQLIDALTSYISLYHSRSQSSNSNPNPNPRSSVLKWFSSLTVRKRQSHLTVVDPNFVQTLLQMLRTLPTRGHGLFIVLRDLLSGNLPSVCFKKSRGLLARVSESNQSERSIFDATRLFSSREGEAIEECSSSAKSLDSVTVSEELVENFDRFVEAMDGVSNGGFLRGEESELGLDWVELKWLKAKGYYSIEAFVANRLEVALRLAWLNNSSGNGKKRGVKLKEKASSAGVAANVYWRKKGCLDWWENLDSSTRKKIFNAVLGKSARNLCRWILKDTDCGLEDELWLFNTGSERPLRYKHIVNTRKTASTLEADAEFGSNIVPSSVSGKSASLSNALNGLFVLRDIVTMTSLCRDFVYDDKGKIFFSTLSSICTVSDFIIRKVRGFLMVIWLACTKLELIAEENEKSSPIKSKGKAGSCSHKKKGKACSTKKLNPVEGGYLDLRDRSPKEPTKAVGVGKSQSAARKTRREKGKNRISGLKNPVEVINCKRPAAEASSSSIPQNEAVESYPVSVHSTFQNITGENSSQNDVLASSPLPVVLQMDQLGRTILVREFKRLKARNVTS